jgi:cytochrome c biogenesis protein CcdA
MDATRLSLSFSAGLLAMLAPCAIPMLPSYVAFYLNTDEEKNRKLSSAIIFGLITVAGFLTIFLGIGLIPSFAVNYISKNSYILTMIVGSLLIFIGLISGWTDKMSNIPIFTFNTSSSTGIRAFYFYGFGYGIASLTCSLPIFLLVVLQSATSTSYAEILLLFAAYGIGAAFLIIPLTIAVVYSREILYHRLISIVPFVKKINGLILILAGLYMIFTSKRFAS